MRGLLRADEVGFFDRDFAGAFGRFGATSTTSGLTLARSSSGFRYWPVKLSGASAIVSGVPFGDDLARRSRRRPGPRSITQSAVLMTSRLCSITTTVLPLLDQAVEHFEQLAHVLEMEAGGGLVEDVERLAGGAAADSSFDELDALRLAAAERRRLLADLDVAEADLLQHLHLVADAGDRLEELGGVLDRHVEHVGDATGP